MIILNREEIGPLINNNQLVENYIDLAVQLTPNGIDLTVEKIFEFDSAGAVDFSNKERTLPGAKEIAPRKSKPEDKFGWWVLNKGVYKVKTNEIVNLPHDLIALAFTRTTLLRMGAFTQHGVWDAGFKGKAEFLLAVENPAGVNIKQNARVAQLIFVRINETNEGYSGVYKNLK